MPEDINSKFQKIHLTKIKASQEKIKRSYLKVIDRVYKKAAGVKIRSENFKVSDYPGLANSIDQELLSFSEDVELELLNGIKSEWELAITKNHQIINKNYNKDGFKVSDQVNSVIIDPQAEAMEQFILRKSNGLGLSNRVWKYTNQFRSEIEQNLYAGLSEGLPAAEMARMQKQYLENPDMLFRRVRNSKGKLILSKNAKEFHPGKGIYRSSYKNAMRLTRDTVNDSYRQSDMVKYQSLPFVLGFTVSLSNNHPVRDICDDLQGTYPTTFVWLKWHNQCLCSCAPKLASAADYARYEQAILDGTDQDFKFRNEVLKIPPQLYEYVEKSKERMAGWARKPEWVTENGIKI